MSCAGGAAVGLVVDSVVGDPSNRAHPVAWFGRAMERVEGVTWADSRARGAVHAATGLVLGLAAGRVVGSTAVVTAVSVGGRSLEGTARSVARSIRAGDLDGARSRLPALVGRDVDGLDEKEVCRAVVESVAENTVDAVVAPALWAAVAGARGAAAHRAVNTMDAMVGHRSDRYERFGWASARLDDLANWVPARATALLVMAARPRRAGAVARSVVREAGRHPSPNAGVAEAAWAAALGVTLGGANRYGDRIDERPRLGDGPPPSVDDVDRAVTLARDVRLGLATLLGVAALARRGRRGRPARRTRRTP